MLLSKAKPNGQATYSAAERSTLFESSSLMNFCRLIAQPNYLGTLWCAYQVREWTSFHNLKIRSKLNERILSVPSGRMTTGSGTSTNVRGKVWMFPGGDQAPISDVRIHTTLYKWPRWNSSRQGSMAT